MADKVQNFEGAIDKGLEGVVACSTAISSIVGDHLLFRGYTIEDLAEKSCFEAVTFLLWEGRMPNDKELQEFKGRLTQELSLSSSEQNLLKELSKAFPKNGHPMDFLRSAVSILSFDDPQATAEPGTPADKQKALRITARMGTVVAAFERLRTGKPLVAPQAGKSLAWNFLNMLFGKEPTAEAERIFDKALILHADHELNCSAFAARVTSSSLSDIYSAVVSAIGALKGPLHGGANTAVMKMLLEIGSIDKAKDFVEKALEGKKKVMGIGHRVYKNGDPRARILRKISQELTKKIGKPELYEMSALIDDTMLEKKGLMPNVDFYSATVYYSMGIPLELYTPIFAVSRVSGWCAHVLEQYAHNRIYRPRGKYTGPTGLQL